MFRRGTPPHANYLFKHALVQDTAYESLLRSRRQQLHGKIASTLEQRFPTLLENQPELAAHHFFEAGLAERAVEYWRQAGLLAIQRSALIEAVSHLSSAIEALELLPESDETRRQKLDLLVAKITPVAGARGYSSVEIEELHNEAVALCEVIGDTPQIFPVLYAKWIQAFASGQMSNAVDRAEQFLSQATKQNAEFPTIQGRRVLGASLVMIGKPHAAVKHFEELDAVLDRDMSDRIGFVYGQDALAAVHCYRSFGLCALGRFESGFSFASASMHRVEEVDNALSRGYVYGHFGILYSMMRESAKLTRCLQSLEIHLEGNPMPIWDATKTYLEGVLAFQKEQYEQAESAITEAMITFDTMRWKLWRPIFLGFLAETRLAQGDVDTARRHLDESIAVIELGGDPWAHADAYRIKAKVAAHNGARDTEITAIYRVGFDLARSQSNKIFELRVGLDLARHLRETGDTAEATRLTRSMYASLPEPGESCLAAECRSMLRPLGVEPT